MKQANDSEGEPMSDTLPLSRDTRPIYSIVGAQMLHTVGSDGVTKISAVDEYGQMSYVPWFEVWRGDKLYARVNAAFVHEVYYQEGQPDGTEF